ncbi:MAG: biotin--[acetyl-CoA-carboxylase] ligase [Saprospiraceae bacterium]
MSLTSLFVGKNRQHFETLESTHQYLADLLSKINPHGGYCISSDFQSGGRGQIGRSWHSERGKNILVSYVFYPEGVAASASFVLNQWVSVALVDVLLHYNIYDVTIKWPNDVYVGKKKIGGILIQNMLRGQEIKSSIISVGLNVNQVAFPDDLPNPTSMNLETATTFNSADVLASLHHFLEKRYTQFKKETTLRKLKKVYISRLFGVDTFNTYQKEDGTIFQAKVHEVGEDGVLYLLDDYGKIEGFLFRNVRMII